jgi:PIN domain nuclease of toxin-antitoxin system
LASLLLDTHALLWFVWDDPRLSSLAKQLIEESDNRKLVSLASCWEIAIKAGLGKLQFDEPAGEFLAREIETNRFELLPISFDDVAAVEALPRHHGDPFDRLLVVQANSARCSLISNDATFDAYGVQRAW